MTTNKCIATCVALLMLALVGCGESSEAPADTDRQAGREMADAMATEHAADTTDPSPAAEQPPARPVLSQDMPYTELNDELVYGYFSAPEDMFEPLPAVIMIHEWWGLNDNVRAMADRLAAEGYIVFAVDLYGGQTADTSTDARQLMLQVVEDPEAAASNIQAAYEFLENTAGAPRVASLGWCFGGAWSLRTATLFPDELDATVIYYGQVSADEETLRPVNVPILGLFAADDRGIPVKSVEAFRDTLQNLRKDHAVHIYPDVGHAFANPTGQRYNAAAAEDAWKRTLAFLELHLGSNDPDVQ